MNYFIQKVKDMNLNMTIVLITFLKRDFVLYPDIFLTMAEISFFFGNRLKHNIAVLHYIYLCKTLICIFAFTLNAFLLDRKLLFPSSSVGASDDSYIFFFLKKNSFKQLIKPYIAIIKDTNNLNVSNLCYSFHCFGR